MSAFLSEIASKVGVSSELAKKGLGLLLSSLKAVLPPETYAKVAAVIPGSDDAISSAETEEEGSSGGGLLGTILTSAGKLLGGGAGVAAAATSVIAALTKAGFSAEQVQSFLAHIFQFLRDKLPADHASQLSAFFPAQEAESH